MILKKVVGFVQRFLSVNQRCPVSGVSVNWRLERGQNQKLFMLSIDSQHHSDEVDAKH